MIRSKKQLSKLLEKKILEIRNTSPEPETNDISPEPSKNGIKSNKSSKYIANKIKAFLRLFSSHPETKERSRYLEEEAKKKEEEKQRENSDATPEVVIDETT